MFNPNSLTSTLYLLHTLYSICALYSVSTLSALPYIYVYIYCSSYMNDSCLHNLILYRRLDFQLHFSSAPAPCESHARVFSLLSIVSACVYLRVHLVLVFTIVHIHSANGVGVLKALLPSGTNALHLSPFFLFTDNAYYLILPGLQQHFYLFLYQALGQWPAR